MKSRLLPLLLLSIMSCNESDPQKAEEYSDITGTWVFAHENVSAEFEIVKTLDGKYATEAGNTFKINGKSHTSTNSHAIYIDGLKIGGISMSTDNAEMHFIWVTYKSDFTEITFEELSYRDCVVVSPCGYEAILKAMKVTRA